MNEQHPQIAQLHRVVEQFKILEHEATLSLNRTLRDTPFAAFQKAHKGVGEKQLSRLLAKIQDPYWNSLHGRPRKVSELWAYCGLHVSNGRAVKRQRGVQSNWSQDAKMRAYLIATSCIKQMDGGYREIYDTRRKHTIATNPDWSLGQSHNDGLRIVSKTLLKDLWIYSRDLHA